MAGIALMVIVAGPMTVAAQQAATGGTRVAGSAVAAGALLIGWIIIEIAVIRTFSWLQPTFAAAGVAELLAGLAPRRHPTSRHRGGDIP